MPFWNSRPCANWPHLSFRSQTLALPKGDHWLRSGSSPAQKSSHSSSLSHSHPCSSELVLSGQFSLWVTFPPFSLLSNTPSLIIRALWGRPGMQGVPSPTGLLRGSGSRPQIGELPTCPLSTLGPGPLKLAAAEDACHASVPLARGCSESRTQPPLKPASGPGNCRAEPLSGAERAQHPRENGGRCGKGLRRKDRRRRKAAAGVSGEGWTGTA